MTAQNKFNSKGKIALIILLIIVIIAVLLFFTLQNKFPKTVSNQAVSGTQMRSQIWSGEITITGDVLFPFFADLTILPGTQIKFVVGDDVGWGEEVPADGYNDFDPTRLKSYDTTHSSLIVSGKLTAKGTPDQRIIFTSAASKPNYADWVGITVGGDGSIVEYCLIEWSRHGVTLSPETPNTVIKNNIMKRALWSPISADYSSAQIYYNEIWEAGHEGIDVQGGNPIIENNRIYNTHTGIVILSGSATVKNNKIINAGDGIFIESRATPTLENNYIELAPDDSTLEWGYENFYYVLFSGPIIKE